jgi:hypothetical protein
VITGKTKQRNLHVGQSLFGQCGGWYALPPLRGAPQ